MPLPEVPKMTTPAWITTFADLISLLLTFFILLLTFSTAKREKLFELKGSISGAFGFTIKSAASSDVRPLPVIQGRDQKNQNSPRQIPRFRPLMFNDPNDVLYQLRDRSGGELDVDRIAEGYRIRLRGGLRYAKGDDRMTAASYAVLSKVMEAILGMPLRIVAVGYAGQDELEELGQQRATDLALRRTLDLVKRLQGEAEWGITPDQLGVAAYGPQSPDDRLGTVDIVLVDLARAGGRR